MCTTRHAREICPDGYSYRRTGGKRRASAQKSIQRAKSLKIIHRLFAGNKKSSYLCTAFQKWGSIRGVAQPGSAPGLGPGCRRFESCHPDKSESQVLENQALVFLFTPIYTTFGIFVTFVAKSPIVRQYDFSSEQFKSRSSITFPFLVFQSVVLSLDDTVGITVLDGVLYRVYVIEQPVPK